MKNAILFSGQGAQYPGMFVELIEKYDFVREIFEDASSIVNINLINLCRSGSKEELSLTENLQPLILACDIASWKLLENERVKADFFAGYSLGEYAALYASGFISFKDVFELITVRAQAMQTSMPVGTGGMAAVIFTDGAVVDNYFVDLDKKVWISNKNTKGQYSIAGLKNDLKDVCADLTKMGVLIKKVPVSVPFHCELLKPAADIILNKLKTIDVHTSSVPIVVNYDGKPETNVVKIKEKVYYQSFNAVQWIDTMSFLYENDVKSFIECGPGHTLSNFARRMRFNDAAIYNVENEVSFQKTIEGMSGLEV